MKRDGKAATSDISVCRRVVAARQNVSRETPVSFERYNQQPRAQTRHLAQNARLFENVSRETPVSFERYKQQPRARIRPFARNALFENVSRETSKALPESFIRSGEFYKKRSVAEVFAQTGLGGRLVCTDSCCCGAERFLLKNSGKTTAVRSNRSCATATLPRRRRQKQSAAVFAPERFAFPIARGAGVL